MTNINDRAAGCLLGLAIGDAVGTTLEFRGRDTYEHLTDMVGGGPFNLKPGEWTDDTSMALCLSDSLIAKRGLDADDLMHRFLNWYEHGENSVTGRCFDIGNQTRSALLHYKTHGRPIPPRASAAGNGSLMRLAPIVLFYHDDAAALAEKAMQQSDLTHPAAEPAKCCALYAARIARALAGLGIDKSGLASLEATPRNRIKSTGYVVDTMQAALWSIVQTTNFRDAILLAANLGDDADTVAAVSGQLAGALYGKSGIPSDWLEMLAWREKIERLALLLISQT